MINKAKYLIITTMLIMIAGCATTNEPPYPELKDTDQMLITPMPTTGSLNYLDLTLADWDSTFYRCKYFRFPENRKFNEWVVAECVKSTILEQQRKIFKPNPSLELTILPTGKGETLKFEQLTQGDFDGPFKSCIGLDSYYNSRVCVDGVIAQHQRNFDRVNQEQGRLAEKQSLEDNLKKAEGKNKEQNNKAY